MTALALVLAAIVALILALLAVPVEFGARASLAGPGAPFQRSARFRWAFGLVDVALSGKKRKTQAARPKARPRKKTRAGRRVARLIFNPAAWERVRVLLSRLVRTVHWPVLRLHGRFGLDDPADTGQLWGGLAPMIVLIPRGLDVRLQPVFAGADLAFDGEARVRFVPLRLIGVLLAFGLSPATWRVLWAFWKNK